MLDTAEIVRISSDTLLVNGMVVIHDEENNFWKTISGVKLSGIQYRKIYTFIDEERLIMRKRFNEYVDRTIKKLIG